MANLRDITERKEAEELLAHRAVHDPLTGLANRTLILDRAEQMLVRCRRTQEPVAALFIDLDNFKEVNDTLGHEAGDKLLRADRGPVLGHGPGERHGRSPRRRRVRRAAPRACRSRPVRSCSPSGSGTSCVSRSCSTALNGTLVHHREHRDRGGRP